MFPASPKGVKLKRKLQSVEGFNIKEGISAQIYPRSAINFLGMIWILEPNTLVWKGFRVNHLRSGGGQSYADFF